MTLMTLTGNYGFYPLLTLTLCLSLIDDTWLNSWTGHGLVYKGRPPGCRDSSQSLCVAQQQQQQQ